MDGNQICRRSGGLKAYTTVFLAVIMSVYTMAVAVMIDVSSLYAAKSIGKNVCASVGRSVLSEYQSELYRRYGIFLLRRSKPVFEKKANLYLNGSLIGKRGTVRFIGAAAELDMAFYPGTSNMEMKRQIKKVSIGVNEYILAYFSTYTDTLPNTYQRYEVERIICGGSSDEENCLAVKERLIAIRTAVNLATLNKEDLDISAIGTVIEAVIPGHLDDAAVEVSQALEQAKRDADVIMAGGRVPLSGTAEDFGRYKDYLRIMLALVPEDIKFARMRTVMENNIRMMDMIIFSFSDYVYGFDMRVLLTRRSLTAFFGAGKNVQSVWLSFTYK